MRTLAFWLGLSAAAAAQDRALVKEYEAARAKLKEKDASGHYKLGAWALSKGLTDLAEREFEHVLGIDPKHAQAREKLGYKREKGDWIESPERLRRQGYRKRVEEGMKLPLREELEALSAKGAFHAKVAGRPWAEIVRDEVALSTKHLQQFRKD
jgi:hypothetical protein